MQINKGWRTDGAFEARMGDGWSFLYVSGELTRTWGDAAHWRVDVGQETQSQSFRGSPGVADKELNRTEGGNNFL